jgi:heat shock protein HslJ
MQKQQITGVTVLALLTLAACGTESGAGSGDSGGSVRTELPLTDVHWSIDSVTVDGRKTPAPAGAGLEINSDGRAGAGSGCNSIGADVTVEGHTVAVGETQSTKKACPVKTAAFERAFSSAFAGKLTAEIDGERLTLTGRDGDAIALTPERAAPLTGTKWTVNSLVAGDTVTSLPKGTSGKAYFTFGKDGRVSGNLGCNSFSGSARAAGSTLTFGRLASTRKLCPGPQMTLEHRVEKVLEGKVTYELGHRTLSLTAAGGRGLRATANRPDRT